MDTRYRQVSGVEVAPMLEETILYHPDKQRFFVLNTTAAFVWDQMKAPVTEGDLASAVAEGFAGIAAADAQRDVASMLRDLRDMELIELSSVEEPNARQA